MIKAYVVLLGLLTIADLSNAAPTATAPHIKVQLVSEHRSAPAHGTTKVGLLFAIEDGWHIYWRNPGDSGETIKANWQLPEGVIAGDIDWPAPERIPIGPLVNFGYKKNVLLPVTLTIASDSARSRLPIKVDLRWLVCQEECIPGKAKLDLTLPINTNALPSEAATKFKQAQALTPKAISENWQVNLAWKTDAASLKIQHQQELQPTDDVFFFPQDAGIFVNAAAQTPAWTSAHLNVDIRLDENLNTKPERIAGVLKVADRFYNVDVNAQPDGGSIGLVNTTLGTTLWQALILAFLGGIILNCMPCVFPVLSIKAVGLLKQSKAQRQHARQHGLLYTLGVLISFWLLAGTLLALRAGGEQLGWGFQLQSPLTIFGLALLLFMMGLNLAGVFEIRASWVGIGHGLASRQEAIGAFFSGVLATIVATPCTAPFMGTALGYAVAQPAPVALGVFTSLALGLAAPYLLLSWFPYFGRLLPKPGRWMETMKQVMAFPLFATVIWLLWVLDQQLGANAVATALLACLMAAMAAWTYERWQVRAGTIAASVMIVLAAALSTMLPKTLDANAKTTTSQSDDSGWVDYTRADLNDLLTQRKPVFIDFTAAWCVTCKLNEAVALGPDMIKEMRRRGIVPMRADWTNDDPEITAALQEFGRDGVPLYVLYDGTGKDPVILPQILTTAIVMSALDNVKL